MFICSDKRNNKDKIGKNELQNAIVEFPTTNISTHIDLADIIQKLRG